MSARAKFLADLKRNAKSPRASEQKRSLPCYSPGFSTVSDDGRSKRKRPDHPSINAALGDLMAPPRSDDTLNEKNCAVGGEQIKAVLSSKDDVGRPFEAPVKARNEKKEGSCKIRKHKSHEDSRKRLNLSVKDALTADYNVADGFEMTIKHEPLSETDVGCAQSGNDDLSFLMSLLPHIRSIPLEKKLRFRSRINEVVDEFAYSNVTKTGS